MAELTDGQIVLKGSAKTVAYAIDAQGRMPAKDFLEKTQGRDAPTDQEKAGLAHVFKVMADIGRIASEEQFKKERGEIWGFKKYQARIAAFQVGNMWYLTHGFKKKKGPWPRTELDRADRIRSEYLGKQAKDNKTK